MHKALGLVAILLVGLVGGCGDKTPPQAPATSGGRDAGAKPKPSSATGNSANTSSKPTKSSSTAQRPAAEQQAINDVRKLNGKIQYADSAPDSPVIKVSFKSQRRVKGTDLGILAPLTTIQELDLGGTSVTDISLIGTLPKLKTLYLPNLAPDQFDTLAKLPSLDSLSVGIDKPSLASSGIDNPYKNRAATKDFDSQDFLKQSLERLSGSRSLTNLRITQGGSATIGKHAPRGDSFTPLSRFPSLTFLEIPLGNDADDAFIDFSKCGSLQALIVSNITHKGMSNLSGSKSLKHLHVTNILKDSEGIVRAASTMPALERITYVLGKVSDSLLIQLKRDNPRLVVEQKKRDLWSELVVGNQ